MYMRCPVNCSSASETEATSTRRKSAIKLLSDCAAVVPAADCARSSPAPHKTAHKMPMDSTEAAMVWDFTQPRNLFISSSPMYICAQTLTLFFIAWKSQSIHHQRETENENHIADENSPLVHMRCHFTICHGHGRAAKRCPGTKSGESIVHQGPSFQRRRRGREHSLHRGPGGYGRFRQTCLRGHRPGNDCGARQY